jgi:hypothetical protein
MNRMLSMAALACLVHLVGLVAQANAGDCCCAHCGCSSCRKVCRLVCEDKKVEVPCFGVICEDFCLAKHDKPGCEHCKIVCVDCAKPRDPGAPYVKPKRFVWTDWIPGCATMHTRKKLMKKTETVTVPSFKWVVEDCCTACEATAELAAVGPEDSVPAPPELADAKLLYRVK